MKAREVLTELFAKKTDFSAILKDSDILMGFECEMILNDSKEDNVEIPAVNVNDLTYDELIELMDDVSNETRTEISNDFQKWHRKTGKTIDAFVQSFVDGAEGFIVRYRLFPRYGWTEIGYNPPPLIYTSSPDEASYPAYQRAATSLQQHLGIEDIEIFGEHNETDKSIYSWYIEPDGSILDTGQGVPAEIVSSVYRVNTGLRQLERLFSWMRGMGHETDDSTGLHINLSIEGKTRDDYDFLKMLILFDENYTANLFDRLENANTLDMRSGLRARLRRLVGSDEPRRVVRGNDMKEILAELRAFGRHLFETFDKYYSINARPSGVFEFRGMGGQHYETKFDSIRKRVVNMAYLLKVGSDDTLMARDYVKKVFEMLDQGKFVHPDLGFGKQSASGKPGDQVPFELDQFAPMFRKYRFMLFDVQSKEPVAFLTDLGKQVMVGLERVTPAQQRQLRRYVLVNKVQPADMRAYAGPKIYNSLAPIIGWPSVAA